MIICLLDSFLIVFIRDHGFTGREKTHSFNTLPRSADPFRCDRGSIPENVHKPGQNILLYIFIF